MHDWMSISNLLYALLNRPVAEACFLTLAEKIALKEDITPIMRDIFTAYRDSTDNTAPLTIDGLYPADIMIVGGSPDSADCLSELPFTGLHTLASSRCGKCSKAGRCYAKFMGNQSETLACERDELITLEDIVQLPNLTTQGQVLDTVIEELGLERQSWQGSCVRNKQERYPSFL